MGKQCDPDVAVLRDLVKQYAQVCQQKIQQERRGLWTKHNSLERTRPPILVSVSIWDAWSRDFFGDDVLKCQDPLFRQHERQLRVDLFHATLGDDFIFEPWITQGATLLAHPDGLWALPVKTINPAERDGAHKLDPPIKTLDDARRMVGPHHVVDEQDTAKNVSRLRDAIGDLIEVNADRSPFRSFATDISYFLARLRGLEQLMLDMVENPEWLHGVLAFMRDAILTLHEEAERAGDWSLTSQSNQAMVYCQELERPRANAGARRRKDLWTFCAAQELALVSPRMHEEFMLRYQRPIIEEFALAAYGCCEDLTNKIGILRQLGNLRRIAVAPTANVARCAEQIGQDYILSWRPSPADMVCCGFDEGRIRRIIREGLLASRGCCVDITLKDVHTVEGQPERLARWVQVVREMVEEF